MSEEVFNAGNADLSNIDTKVMDSDTPDTESDSDSAVKLNENGRPDVSTLEVDEDGLTVYVTPDMIIGDILKWYPDAAMVLMRCGMHCITCGVSQYESLEQACAVHGLYVDDVAKVVNDYLTQTLGGRQDKE